MDLLLPIEIDTDSKQPLAPYISINGLRSEAPIRKIEEHHLNVDGTFVDVRGRPRHVSGLDSNGVRVTNLAGFRDRRLIKWCPNCEENRPQEEFGAEGRPDTNRKGRRDQSWCNVCRPSSRR